MKKAASLSHTSKSATSIVQPRPNRRGEQRSRDILKCATEMFLARGFDNVSLNEIVEEVGGSKTNVYSYFGDKEGLFRASMDALIAEILGPLKKLKLGDYPLEAGLKEFATSMLSILLRTRHLAYQRLIFAEATRHRQIGQMWLQNGPLLTRGYIVDFLKLYQDRGDIAGGIDLPVAAALFHDMIIWNSLLQKMFSVDGGPSKQMIEAHVDEAISVFLRGVMKS